MLGGTQGVLISRGKHSFARSASYFILSHTACCGQLGQPRRMLTPHARGAGQRVAPKGSSLLAAQLVSNSKTICQAQRCSPDSKAACSALR